METFQVSPRRFAKLVHVLTAVGLNLIMNLEQETIIYHSFSLALRL